MDETVTVSISNEELYAKLCEVDAKVTAITEVLTQFGAMIQQVSPMLEQMAENPMVKMMVRRMGG